MARLNECILYRDFEHGEILDNEYTCSAAFAVSSLLALLAIVTLILKTWVEVRQEKQNKRNDDSTVS